MKRIGKYELIELLGKGGMGEVWKARDAELDRIVALKLMQGTEPEDLARFKREARVVARLSHPNIAALYDVGEDPPHIALQFIDGTPLDRSPLPMRAKVAALAQAAQGVHYAHGHGVLHRDLKPANLMVDAEGRGIVLDFGLARDVTGDATALSLSGDIMGTPSYLSPEQAMGRVKQLDARTDVYGLGASLYALLAGRPPHGGESLLEVVHSAANEDPPRPGGDRDLEIICMKALEREPERRYAAAADFAEDLERYLRQEPIVARPASMFYRWKKRVQRQPMFWSLVLALVIATAAGGGVIAHQIAARGRDRRAAEAHQALLARLDGAGRRLGELRPVLARAQDAAGLATLYGELDATIERLGREIETNPVEAASASFLRGEALMMCHRVAEAVAAYGRALAAPETEWSRKGGVAIRAAHGRARAHMHQMLLATASTTEAQRKERRAAARRTYLPAIDDALVRLRGGNAPAEFLSFADVLIVFLEGDYASVDAKSSEEIQRGGPVEDFLFLRGLARLNQRDLPAAIEDFASSVSRNRNQPLVLFHLGIAEQFSDRHRNAVTAYDEAIDRMAEFPLALNARGQCHMALDDFERARRDFDLALKFDPRFTSAWTTRSQLRMKQGDFDGAIADGSKAIDLDPASMQALAMRGSAYTYKGMYVEAFDDYDRALKIEPDHAGLLASRGAEHVNLGRPDIGLVDLDRSLALEPGNARALNFRARARSALGRHDEAMADIDAALQAHPGDATLLVTRGTVRVDMKDYEGALADSTQVLATYPDYPDALYLRGVARFKARDLPGAEEDLSRLVQLEPSNANAILMRANVRFHAGNERGAADDYRTALRLGVKDAEGIRARLKDLEKRIGTDF